MSVEPESRTDRWLYDWQTFAVCFDGKTVDAHLLSIREFERVIAGRPFAEVRDRDAGGGRAALIARTKIPDPTGDHGRSAARHRASHLRTFFEWLAKQAGFKPLERVSGYVVLPRGVGK